MHQYQSTRSTDLDRRDKIEWAGTVVEVTAITSDEICLDGIPFSREDVDTYFESDSINFRRL